MMKRSKLVEKKYHRKKTTINRVTISQKLCVNVAQLSFNANCWLCLFHIVTTRTASIYFHFWCCCCHRSQNNSVFFVHCFLSLLFHFYSFICLQCIKMFVWCIVYVGQNEAHSLCWHWVPIFIHCMLSHFMPKKCLWNRFEFRYFSLFTLLHVR